MGRRRKVVLLVTACLAGAAVLAWLNRPRDEPTRATVDEAVQSFRAESGFAPRRDDPGKPALGVYRYATRGSESVKSPIFGTTHHYGGVSTIVLSAGRCGERERWQVLAGRWSEAETCSESQGKVSAMVTEFHEFFDVGQKDSFRCRSGPVPTRPGARFSSHCESQDSSISSRSRIVATKPISIDGVAYDATEVESRSVFGGGTSGSSRRTEWRRKSDGLLLRRTTESEADTGDAGGSHYEERYTLTLLSTAPRR